MKPCSRPPANKKEFSVKLGKSLVEKYGKRRYYTIDQTRDRMSSLGYPIDYYCWGHALFVMPSEFISYHQSIGESCDQLTMKSELTSAITDGASDSWFDIDLSWIEWPDIDIASIFDISP